MRARKTSSLLVALFVASLPSACAVNPVTGRPELTTMSPAREAAVGREAAEQVQSEMGLVDDPSLQAYVDRVGQRLAAFSPRKDTPYDFHVVELEEPNAFALPGGHVYVSRGLLALVNSEDELANVMGHEVGHVAARHAAQRETRSTGVGILSALGTIAAGILAGGEAAQAVGQLSQVAGGGLIASYSRDQEREADAIGQQIASAAGYDPAAMASFLDTLERWTRLESGGPRRPGFLDSHPATPERVAATASRAETLHAGPAAPVAPTRVAFLGELEGLRVGPNVEEGVVEETLFLHPGMDLSLRFPAGWRVENQRHAVVAGAPEGDALLGVELLGPGTDARAAASAFVQRNGLRPAQAASFRTAEADGFYVAAPVATEGGQVAGWIGFVPHGGQIFRVTGLASLQTWRSRFPRFQSTAESLGPLSREERARLRDRRLRVATAQGGDTLGTLSSREGNVWRLQETAVANALSPDVRLVAGQPVKIVVAHALPAASEPAR
ncbi:MAG TPA: M48 family metalloprotease [Myxococcota bacterium]|jgi:predicted Zn-dependent protease|nr:M48 family metalloprotease [Myxococcota bacterium]